MQLKVTDLINKEKTLKLELTRWFSTANRTPFWLS